MNVCAGLQLDDAVDLADPKLRPLDVAEDRDVLAVIASSTRRMISISRSAIVVRSVREVQAEDVDARGEQAMDASPRLLHAGPRVAMILVRRMRACAGCQPVEYGTGTPTPGCNARVPPPARSRRTRARSARRLSGRIACGPSESASSGLWCTSIRTPSAPTAIAARDIGSDLVALAGAVADGSTRIGRWEMRLMAGTIERSSVLRVWSANVRTPRSQRITL